MRGIAIVVAAGLLLSATGCVTGERRAGRSLNRISEGMSEEDVRDLLGEADRITHVEDAELWHYSYGSLPDPGKIAETAGETLLVMTFVGGFYLLIAYAQSQRGNSSSSPDLGSILPRGDGTTASGRVRFQVAIDQAGRVMEISGIEPDEDP